MTEANYHHRSYQTIACAIGILSERFVNICLPIRNSFYYDLVAEKDFCLFRIKAIFTSCKQPSGSYVANIRKSGGYTDKKESKLPFDPKFCDYLYVETPDAKYLIPTDKIFTVKSITLSQFESFRISSVVEQ